MHFWFIHIKNYNTKQKSKKYFHIYKDKYKLRIGRIQMKHVDEIFQLHMWKTTRINSYLCKMNVVVLESTHVNTLQREAVILLKYIFTSERWIFDDIEWKKICGKWIEGSRQLTTDAVMVNYCCGPTKGP